VHGRGRCELPAIRAEELEERVWDELIGRLSFGGFKLRGEHRPSALEAITDPARYDVQIAEYDSQLAYLDADLKKLNTIRKRLFGLLEKDRFNADEFMQRLRGTDEDIQRLLARKAEVESQMDELHNLKENMKELSDFVAVNREWLQQIQEQLYHLNPDDKKRMVESLVVGRIRISTNQEDGSWDVGPLNIRFNSNIFKVLADEGKISIFNKNGSNPSIGP
jgi:hypothetical protein